MFRLAPAVNVSVANAASMGKLTDFPETVTRSRAPGTPLGLQLAEVDQLPPLAGPIQVLTLPQLASLISTEMLFDSVLVEAASARPSPLKSPTTSPRVPVPDVADTGGPNVP